MAYYSRVISYQNDGNIENGPFVHILLFPMGHFFSGESGPLQLDTMVDITIYMYFYEYSYLLETWQREFHKMLIRRIQFYHQTQHVLEHHQPMFLL